MLFRSLAAAIEPSCGLQELLAAAGALVGRPLSVETVDSAAAAGLVDVDAAGHVLFRHPLMASAIHQAASFADRVKVHAALADALDHVPDRQVWHRAAATVGIDEPLSRDVELSAEQVLQRGAPAMAVGVLRR